MRTKICAALIIFGASVASAQPGLVPPAYAYQPQLSDDDRELLTQGEINSDKQVGGGVAAILLGFGIGQAVQGRWHETGWIYTAGESVSFLVLFEGIMAASLPHGPHCNMPNCAEPQFNTPIVVGLIGYGAFHVAEIVDAFVAPGIHNRHVRAARDRASRMAPYIAPRAEGGAVGGVAMRF